MMIWAIVGARTMTDKLLLAEGIAQALSEWGRPDKVISGGAEGADTMGISWARQEGIPTDKRSYRPDWRRLGKRAGLARNTDLVRDATHVLAFPSYAGSGTQDTIRKAKAKGIPVITIYIDKKKKDKKKK